MDRITTVIETSMQGSTITYISDGKSRTDHYSTEEHLGVLRELQALQELRG